MKAFGCEDKNKTPIPEDRICPKCGKEVEVFVSRGRVVEAGVCECGYVIEAEEHVITVPNKKEKE